MFLGIEIGGTKLQLGIGESGRTLIERCRLPIDRAQGGLGIREQIKSVVLPWKDKYRPRALGFGFGGPIDHKRGRVVKSHQVEGWDDFPLADWCQKELGLPAILGNDCDVAALAEAYFGAGQGLARVFYVTIGTGIGGGFVQEGRIYRGGALGAAEIGHLRPGPLAVSSAQTVEGIASGLGMESRLAAWLDQVQSQPDMPLAPPADVCAALLPTSVGGSQPGWAASAKELIELSGQQGRPISAEQLFQYAARGNLLASTICNHALGTLGWAVAQVYTLLCPSVVVLGGGVSLVDEQFAQAGLPRGKWPFLGALERIVAEFVFPPFQSLVKLERAQLGEWVVVHGAVQLAAQTV